MMRRPEILSKREKINLRIEKTVVSIAIAVFYYYSFLVPGLPFFLGEFNSVDGSIYVVRAWDVLVTLALFIPITYRLIPDILDQGNILKFSVITLSLFISLCLIELLLDWLVIITFNLPTGENQVSDKALQFREVRKISSSILPGNLILLGISVLFGLSRDWVLKFRHRQVLRQDRLQAELDFLRSQINPHFLFNTLNSIYATSLKGDSSKTSEAILQLSGMMRYMLEDDSKTIELKEEVNHIKNFLDLVLLRFKDDDPLEISFNYDLKQKNVKIVPLLLIPFVENAVKHGISAKGTGVIDINLRTENDRIIFQVYNTISSLDSRIKTNSGIGLKNVKRRLELLYPGTHCLTIDKTDNRFAVELEINRSIN